MEWWVSAGRMERARGRKRDSQRELHVQVGFGSGLYLRLHIQATFTSHAVSKHVARYLMKNKQEEGATDH